MPSVLILGASGTVGGLLHRELITCHGAEVTGTCTSRTAARRRDLIPFDRHRDPRALARELEKAGRPLAYDCVVDCARPCGRLPEGITFSRMVACSTAGVYDYRNAIPMNEDASVVRDPAGALSPEAFPAQRERVHAETLLQSQSAEMGFVLTLCRLSIVLAPGSPRLIPWIEKALSGPRVDVPHGAAVGFVDARDVVTALAAWILTRAPSQSSTINLGPAVSAPLATLEDVIAAIAAGLGREVEIVPRDPESRPDDAPANRRLWSEIGSPAWRLLHLDTSRAGAAGFRSRPWYESVSYCTQ